VKAGKSLKTSKGGDPTGKEKGNCNNLRRTFKKKIHQTH
jgi:hypothetical protein